MKNEITKIVSWKTSDGTVNKTERSALIDQTELDLWEFIQKSDYGDGGKLSYRMLYDWIVENSGELREFLSDLKSAQDMPLP